MKTEGDKFDKEFYKELIEKVKNNKSLKYLEKE
jgi:hypothetical protein